MKTFGFTLSVLATVFLLTAFSTGPVAEAQGAKALDGKKHTKAVTLNDADLGTLISWILAQKK